MLLLPEISAVSFNSSCYRQQHKSGQWSPGILVLWNLYPSAVIPDYIRNRDRSQSQDNRITEWLSLHFETPSGLRSLRRTQFTRPRSKATRTEQTIARVSTSSKRALRPTCTIQSVPCQRVAVSLEHPAFLQPVFKRHRSSLVGSFPAHQRFIAKCHGAFTPPPLGHAIFSFGYVVVLSARVMFVLGVSARMVFCHLPLLVFGPAASVSKPLFLHATTAGLCHPTPSMCRRPTGSFGARRCARCARLDHGLVRA
jgi:hypothetical protein